MSRLTFADRVVMFLIIVVAVGVTFGGALAYVRHGYSVNASATLIGGALVLFLMVIVVMTIHFSTRQNPPETTPEPSPAPLSHDPPPKYRLTWRKEFIHLSPVHLRADLEKILDQESGIETLRAGTSSRLDQESGIETIRIGTVNDSYSSSSPRSSSLYSYPPTLSSSLYPSVSSFSSRSPPFPERSTADLPDTPSPPKWIAVFTESQAACDVDAGLPTYEEVQRW